MVEKMLEVEGSFGTFLALHRTLFSCRREEHGFRPGASGGPSLIEPGTRFACQL